MNDFNLYFRLGIDHILTWEAMDHILFVAALCLRYVWADWKKVAVLVTAFTIGHSVTLAMSALNYVHVQAKWIEFLIPLTIIATALNNLFQKKQDRQKKFPLIYFFALFFGLIHGLAYASAFLDLEGKEGLLPHLFAFNVGIEIAQLVVVAGILLLSFILVQLPDVLLARQQDVTAGLPGLLRRAKISRTGWIGLASFLILAFSIRMAYQRFPHNKKNNHEKTAFISFSSNGYVQHTYCAKYSKQSGV